MGNSQMRAYFAPCGIGLGHAGRSVPIAKKLQQRNATVLFSTYQEGIHYIENAGIPLVKAPALGVRVKPDGTVDFRRTAVNPGPFVSCLTILRQIIKEIAFIEGFKPDIVISDSRASTLIAAQMLRIPSICILNQFQPLIPRRRHHLLLARLADFVNLTIIGRIWTSATAVLIPDFPPPYTISAGNLHVPPSYKRKVKLIGPILEIHPEDLENKEGLRRKLGLSQNKPVIFVPVSGPVKEKAFLTGLLRKILLGFPNKYEIVMSLGYPSTDTKPVRHGNVTIFKWVPNRFEYLKACDITIARAGHGTITQAMSYGRPLVLVPTPGHTEQLNNAKQAQDIGVARIVMQENLTKEGLLKAVDKMLENVAIERMRHVQTEVAAHCGLEKAIQIIDTVAKD